VPVGVPEVTDATCAVSVTLCPGVIDALLTPSDVVVPACVSRDYLDIESCRHLLRIHRRRTVV